MADVPEARVTVTVRIEDTSDLATGVESSLVFVVPAVALVEAGEVVTRLSWAAFTEALKERRS